jgi:hypothetical protein
MSLTKNHDPNRWRALRTRTKLIAIVAILMLLATTALAFIVYGGLTGTVTPDVQSSTVELELSNVLGAYCDNEVTGDYVNDEIVFAWTPLIETVNGTPQPVENCQFSATWGDPGSNTEHVVFLGVTLPNNLYVVNTNAFCGDILFIGDSLDFTITIGITDPTDTSQIVFDPTVHKFHFETDSEYDPSHCVGGF